MSMDLQKVETAIAGMDRVRAGLAALKSQFGGVLFEVQTAAGMKAATEARRTCREPRYEVEKIRKDAKAPLLQLGKDLDRTAAEIEAEILKVEGPIDSQIKAEEKRLADEKLARIKAEADRVAGIRARIQWITTAPLRASGKSAELAAGVVRDLAQLVVGSEFGEFQAPAMEAHAEALKACTIIVEERKQYEADQAELARQREENERLRAEQAERDRLEREEQERTERMARLKREEEERVDREARERQEIQEAARRRAEREEMDRRQAELDRRHHEQEERDRQAREAEEKRLAAAAAKRKPKAPARPSREQVITVVANEYSVSMEISEAWLVAIFAKETA